MEWSNPRTSTSTRKRSKNAEQLTSFSFNQVLKPAMLMALASMQWEAYQLFGFFSPGYHCELQFTGENTKSAEDSKDSNTNRNPKSQKVS